MTEVHSNGAIAYALVYLTFFLDNVLLTVLVPIIPDWIRDESLTLWAKHDAPLAALLDAPLAALLNSTAHRAANTTTTNTAHGTTEGGGGVSQAVVGLVLGAKAAAQLAAAPAAGAAVARAGPAPALRLATLILAAAAIVFASCSMCGARGWAAAWGAGAGRVAHGAGAALAAVAGLALVSAALPPQRQRDALGPLLGAVALGVLVGYPFGGATYAFWSRGTAFLLIAAALLANLAMQYMFLDKEEYNRPTVPMGCGSGDSGVSVRAMATLARRGAVGACAGAVLLTTSVMAALEPCLPLWIMDKFHSERWQTGVVFVPDSAGYLVAASALGGAARRLGAERLALAGVLAVGLAALAVPHAASVAGLAAPHAWLGAGLGATDAALVPALLARARREAAVPLLAALLQAASSAAYALGPVVGGLLSWGVGFETALRTLAVLNLLYTAVLYRALSKYPLSEQWGATSLEDEDCSEATTGAELTPLYTPLHQINTTK